jgi:hypothetical protein
LSEHDIETLFRVDDVERAEKLYVKAATCVLTPSPENDSTENAFIQFWDNNLRTFLEVVRPGGKSIRDSNFHTSTASFRPDFGFLYLGNCPFRGEEKSPMNSEDPRAELAKKMVWTYDPAPYVLGSVYDFDVNHYILKYLFVAGYYATGTVVTFVAICRPPSSGKTPELIDIGSLDLRLTASRIENVIRIINLSSLVTPLTKMIGSREVSEFVPIRR